MHKGRLRTITGSLLSSRTGQQFERGVVKSIQHRSITLTGTLTGTDTFTTVDLNNSIIVHLGNTSNTGVASTNLAWTGLSASGTTMTATRTDTTGTVVVSYSLIEFFPGVIRSVQRGTKAINGSGTPYSQTITAVQNTGKTWVSEIGRTGDSNAWADNYGVYELSLTSTTNLRYDMSFNAGGLTYTSYWQVAEFY